MLGVDSHGGDRAAVTVLQLVNGYVRGAAVPVAERAPDPAVIERSGRAEELPRCSRC